MVENAWVQCLVLFVPEAYNILADLQILLSLSALLFTITSFLLSFFSFFSFLSFETVSLCITQAGLKSQSSCFYFLVLGLQARATTPERVIFLINLIFQNSFRFGKMLHKSTESSHIYIDILMFKSDHLFK
jgi:hypothetical protein